MNCKLEEKTKQNKEALSTVNIPRLSLSPCSAIGPVRTEENIQFY